MGDSPRKLGLIPHVILNRMVEKLKLVMALKEGLAVYQLVGEVMAHPG